jgi:thioredoxin reductase
VSQARPGCRFGPVSQRQNERCARFPFARRHQAAELLEIGREQLKQYDVELIWSTVQKAERTRNGFRFRLNDGSKPEGRRVLLATGMTDKLPDIPGIDDPYGTNVHHCQYCDGWEHRDEPLAAYGKGRSAYGLAPSLKTWSADIVLLTDGPARLSREDRDTLERLGIQLRRQRIARLEGQQGRLQQILFANGDALARRAIFFKSAPKQSCGLGEGMGCEFTDRGAIKTDKFERTCVPGLYAAGDCSRNVQWVAIAVAQGAIAAERINIELQEEDRRRVLGAR